MELKLKDPSAIKAVRTFLKSKPDLLAREAAANAPPPRPAPGQSSQSVKAARAAIERAKKPLMLQPLYAMVASKGFSIKTDTPTDTFGARLRDCSKEVGLVFLQGHGWWLRERPYKAADYRPSAPTRKTAIGGRSRKRA